ncbi:major facilitator superfamily protein [Striga asiatica]|uniref:Major facilitator superfamily protein n=1 Tax=Striga asiatica TaxID=4170 RepID=A0A5A7RDH5_STRAF|nr:major facilitator superfamily protein [Striga asiatica]
MENYRDERKKLLEKPLSEDDEVPDEKKGGIRTLPFIIGIEALEKMSIFGLSPNMTLYLMNEYHLEMTFVSNVLFLWSSATNFMTLVGALAADSFLGRFRTIGIGSIVCLIGTALLWSTAVLPLAKPPPCDQTTSGTCFSPTFLQLIYLCLSFVLITIGAGGIRSSCLAFGANQLEREDFRKRLCLRESYFGWYYAAYAFSTLVALTCVVYVQDNMGWGIGLAVPVALMFVAMVIFFLGSNLYVKVKGEPSLVVGLVRVVVASFRNRSYEMSDSVDCAWHCRDGSDLVFPSQNLRFLNKACVVRDPEEDLTIDGKAKNPWRLCNVDQVEELKALIRVIPIWSTGIIMSVTMSQTTFPILQAASMDRKITSSFSIPPASFNTFAVIAAILWIAVYDRVFLPLASGIKKKPVRISSKRRMGIGVFVSFLATTTSFVVEFTRKSVASRDGSSTHMSALWLVPQYCLIGFAVASNTIAQNEFYFFELPRSMASIALTLNGFGESLASLVASFVMNSVDALSSAGGEESWISSDINKGHYDYYYLVLVGLSMANMIYFVLCSRAYGPLKEDRERLEEKE